MTTVFLDTVGLLAIWDTRDQWHVLASAAFERMNVEKHFPVTSSFVLLECANAAARRPYRPAVARMRETLIISGGLITPSEADIASAWSRYQQTKPGDPGIVDLISFAVMRRLGAEHAFTNDRHFNVEGFSTLF